MALTLPPTVTAALNEAAHMSSDQVRGGLEPKSGPAELDHVASLT